MANDAQVLVRCSTEDKAIGEAKASTVGLSLAEMLRQLMVGSAPPDPSDKHYADIKRAMGDAWFMAKVWPQYLNGSLRKAHGEYLLTGKLPMPPSNGAGTLAHEEHCDCQRCKPPKESKEPAKKA